MKETYLRCLSKEAAALLRQETISSVGDGFKRFHSLVPIIAREILELRISEYDSFIGVLYALRMYYDKGAGSSRK